MKQIVIPAVLLVPLLFCCCWSRLFCLGRCGCHYIGVDIALDLVKILQASHPETTWRPEDLSTVTLAVNLEGSCGDSNAFRHERSSTESTGEGVLIHYRKRARTRRADSFDLPKGRKCSFSLDLFAGKETSRRRLGRLRGEMRIPDDALPGRPEVHMYSRADRATVSAGDIKQTIATCEEDHLAITISFTTLILCID